MMTEALNIVAAAHTSTTGIQANIEKAFAELTTMELNEDIFFAAIDPFQGDPKLCNTFFACPDEMRVRWLFKKLSGYV